VTTAPDQLVEALARIARAIAERDAAKPKAASVPLGTSAPPAKRPPE
jgi:hypothetical protein